MKKIKKRKKRGEDNTQCALQQPGGEASLKSEENYRLGISFHQKGQVDRAIAYYRESLRMNPNFALPHYALGVAFQETGKLDEAASHYQTTIQLDPQNAPAYNNLGSVLQQKGRLTEALGFYEKAVQLKPDFSVALNNHGKILQEFGRIDEAIALHQRALQLNGDYADAHYSLGNAFKKITRFDKAISCYQKALQLDPNFYPAYLDLGNVLKDQGKFSEAEEHYQHAIRIKPDSESAYQALLMTKMYSAEYDARDIFREHLNFAHKYAAPLLSVIRPHTNERAPDRRLRIGYVSPDFRRSAVSFFIEPVLIEHNREEFEIFCYANVPAPDDITGRVQKRADKWRSIVGMSDEEAAELIRKDRIDILVDLAGHSAGNRILIFARKPAPVQVSWLGYPATTGLSTIDYKLVDGHTDPIGETEQFYTEKLERLPEAFLCYMPDRETPDIGDLPALKSEHVTFGSLNNFPKISPDMIRTWSQILCEVPNARLIMKAYSFKDITSRNSVMDIFRKEGISDDRIEMLPWETSLHRHWNTYNRIDIGLDTFPYNGTTTICEALWMGVPVISLAGTTHMSRVGYSLISNIGVMELIARTKDQYVEIAVTLANDSRRLQMLRRELRGMMADSSLTDAGRFTANLEKIYRRIWEKWCTFLDSRPDK